MADQIVDLKAERDAAVDRHITFVKQATENTERQIGLAVELRAENARLKAKIQAALKVVGPPRKGAFTSTIEHELEKIQRVAAILGEEGK